MSAAESEKLIGYRAVRKVVTPSESLVDFLSYAKKLIEDVETVNGKLDPMVYAVEGLRVTILERRVRASVEASEQVRKVYTRMESPFIVTRHKVKQPSGKFKVTTKKRQNLLSQALQDVESLYSQTDSGLLVRANKITTTTKPSDPRMGTEFALVIEEGSGARVLEAQRDILLDTEANMVAGRKLGKLAVGPVEALNMPFMRLPLADEHVLTEFSELLTAGLPVHDIEIGPVELKRNDVLYT